jgi:hypothetical protein
MNRDGSFRGIFWRTDQHTINIEALFCSWAGMSYTRDETRQSKLLLVTA